MKRGDINSSCFLAGEEYIMRKITDLYSMYTTRNVMFIDLSDEDGTG